MKKIKIDGKPYNVPTKWEDVKLSDYIYLKSLDSNDPYYHVLFLSHVTGIDVELFKQSERLFYNKIVKLMDFTNKQIPKEKHDKITIDDVDYYYYGDFKEEACFAQYMEASIRLDEFKGEEYNALPYVLSILYIEKGKNYNSNLAKKNTDFFRNLPITKVFSLFSFFLPKLKKSKKDKDLLHMVNLLIQSTQLNQRDTQKHTGGAT